MTTTERPTNGVHIAPELAQQRDIVKAIRGERPRLEVDTTQPVLPETLRDRGAATTVTKAWWTRTSYLAKRRAMLFPVVLWALIYRSPVGLWRVIAGLSKWVYDQDSAGMRRDLAASRDPGEYARVHAVRKANLHARAMVFITGLALVAAPVLAWTAPYALSTIVAVALFLWTIKIIPGKEAVEYVVALGIAGAVWFFLPWGLELIPHPPTWAFVLVSVVVVLALGWVGRNKEKPLDPEGRYAVPAAAVKPTADMIVTALCRIGITGMTPNNIDKVRDEVRVMAPGVATSAHGYTVELELIPGATAEMVVGKRDLLAGALRFDISRVWPSGREDHHPSYLRLFLSHKPMHSARQPNWPMAKGQPIDVFEPIPLFTDEQMQWVGLTMAGTHTAVGGASGFGKSVWMRHLTCALAFDPRARLVIFDGKLSGDFEHVRKIAHAFHEGSDEDDIEAMLTELNGLAAECTRRAKFLKNLPPEDRSPKVTSTLASKYTKDLAPIFVIVDEIQEYSEFSGSSKGKQEDKKIRERFTAVLTRLSRIGRSAGIFLVLASQKPDASVIPSAIMGNCGIRIAFKVSEQTHNDQILGTSARKNGIDATMFGSRDRGMAWLKGGDAVDAQVVRSWSEMVELDLALEFGDKAYEMRKARRMLTGEAAGEEPEGLKVDLLDDVRTVMDDAGATRMHLAGIVERLHSLRPELYSKWDAAGLGTALRGRGVVVHDQLKVDSRNSSGVRREALNATEDGR